MRRLLASVARNSASEAGATTLAADIGDSAAARQTLSIYLDALRTTGTGPPKALIVVTSTGRPYMRHDGVGVVPITALRP